VPPLAAQLTSLNDHQEVSVFFLFRGRYGALIRAVTGVALVAWGVAGRAAIPLVIGGALIVLALFTGISSLTGRSRGGRL
jgi:hypothetical protein